MQSVKTKPMHVRTGPLDLAIFDCLCLLQVLIFFVAVCLAGSMVSVERATVKEAAPPIHYQLRISISWPGKRQIVDRMTVS